MSSGRTHREAIEQRLRDALQARANSADWEHLRPAAPPIRPRRLFSASRRTVLVWSGLAAAAACALLLLVLTTGASDGPAPPAATPSHSVSPPTSQAPASPATSAKP